ncbi:hypothetical protein WJ0W_006925 [Paenibacillus melissococcoides]|uniref:Replicative helicase inhibitor G39P N-terminal domain-containing protein n=1 Tax=Paenibacillus melissococcoides TaxID=2912268 RepID=A0ABM9GDB6_9BACL|nr:MULTISPECIES: hypothetical protein [Paenibacillus]GIO82786.1 hypothetical protein J6TS7_63960 [Paenibacillus dendritiformis]CAH8249741.1 hypothetical protein WJ0W_006925 [Paenibacillus melissococcoides]CAH8721829.1 hypothetical protein WDD9_006485 [Paenibacillus melissococcoides]
MKLTEVNALLERIGEFYAIDITRNKLEAWHEVIGHMDYEVAKKALIECLQQSEYMPRPADLVKRVETKIDKVELSKEEREYLEQLHRKQRERNTTA